MTRHAVLTPKQKITPFLWYSKQAEEAARFYVSVFPNSRIRRVVVLPAESPSGPAGSVKLVDFVLDGQSFTAMNAGPLDPFNHAVSFVVNWERRRRSIATGEALLEGGSTEQCGWLVDALASSGEWCRRWAS